MGKRKKKLLNQIGVTEDNKIVLSGIFEMVDQEGIPLTTILNYFDGKNTVVDWPCFIKKAINSGWNKLTIFGKLEEAIEDSMPNDEYRTNLILKLKEYCNN